jgi:hypothetical protein
MELTDGREGAFMGFLPLVAKCSDGTTQGGLCLLRNRLNNTNASHTKALVSPHTSS